MSENVLIEVKENKRKALKEALKFLWLGVALAFSILLFATVISGDNIIDVGEELFPILLSLLGGGAVIAIIFYLSRGALTVTNKRVYGRGFLGKRVDLPIDSVSAISLTLSIFAGISVSTSSGRIVFYFIENRSQIYQVLNNLLIERQSAKASQATNSATAQSNADELKKYKELLDNGIITPEEFESKKKQLLGL